MTVSPLFELRGISKEFPGVKALDNVSFEIHAGEVHMLVGENGAGKSTLMKILCGAYRADQGSFFQNGEQVEIDGPTAEPDAAATGKLTARLALQECRAREQHHLQRRRPCLRRI